LSKLQRRDDPVAAIEEAVNLRRRLAASHPETFSADLEQSLKAREWLLELPPNRPTRWLSRCLNDNTTTHGERPLGEP